MNRSMNRRQFMARQASLALAAASAPTWARTRTHAVNVQPKDGVQWSAPHAFSFDWLNRQAQALARQPYVAPRVPVPELIQSIDFDAVQKIRFRPQCTLWKDEDDRLPLRFFHLDRYNSMPVRVFALQGDQAREILYTPQCFDYGNSGLEHKLPTDLGFSGFRVMVGHHEETDWLAFQGASYFRTSGQQNQYGASARGIAVNSVMSVKEEFPRFSTFWIAEPDAHQSSVVIYALLDGPSITGAYRFTAQRHESVTMDVHAELYVRADIQRLGIAPLTSMYWYGENERGKATDWRPEVHDSDGLALWTGKGEHIWRPLINPPSVQTNSFMDERPKGFGLMQRDRDFDNYQDDGAFYNRRPGVWVEPLGDWGAGSVQLAEIPTVDEIHDNIVAFWTPRQSVNKGDHLPVDYRLYWQDSEPAGATPLARVVATRIGRGGVPGQSQPGDDGRRKFVIDFEGGPLNDLKQRFDIVPVLSGIPGKADNPYVIKVVGTNRWRAVFDITPTGKGPFNLRCFLKLGDRTLSETWLYQYFPS